MPDGYWNGLPVTTPLLVDIEKLKTVCSELTSAASMTAEIISLEELRGVEGKAAARYFSVFDELLLQNKDDFFLPYP